MASKSKNSAKTKAAAKQKKQTMLQVWAIVTFFVGLFFVFLAFIKGENVWTVLHDSLFGLFGLSAYVLGAGLIYIGVYCAYQKKEQSTPLLLYIVLLAFGCALLGLIMQPQVAGDTLFAKVIFLFDTGVEKIGGGVFFALLGWPMLSLFGRVGALIILTIVSVATVMILSGKTLVQLLNTAATPVKKTGEMVSRQISEIPANFQKRQKNIDIPLGPDGQPDLEKSRIDIALPETSQPEVALPNETDLPTVDLDSIFGVSQPMAKPPVPDQEEAVSPVQPPANLNDSQGNTPPNGDSAKEPTYKFPPITLLDQNNKGRNKDISAELNANGEKLVSTLKSFGVSTKIINISRGPSVTRYELQPSVGVKISKITNLADDIALNLATSGVRIEAPIPNKAAVGIEVPNREASMVTIRDILSSNEFKSAKSGLTFALGLDIAGAVKVSDIAKMPHMLIAGATGSGKSVCINGIILSILYKSSPEDVRMIMIDPKMVELGKYNGIPHLEIPVVTDPKKAASALNWAVSEMLNRYKLFAANNVRDLASYNKLAESADNDLSKMPQMVIVIDELADLMMASPGEVEDAICRLAQMARAAGMYLIIATQRPSVDVITGVIKANIPSRLALAVSSQVDSRTILDGAGAEKLLGRGDMLFMPVGVSKPVRIQGCYANDAEIERVIEYIKPDVPMTYNEQVQAEIEKNAELIGTKGKKNALASAEAESGTDKDVLHQAVELAVDFGQISTSLLQRKLKLGYARASRIVDQMEEMGIVGPFEGSKPRQVLINRAQWMEMCMNGQDPKEE